MLSRYLIGCFIYMNRSDVKVNQRECTAWFFKRWSGLQNVRAMVVRALESRPLRRLMRHPSSSLSHRRMKRHITKHQFYPNERQNTLFFKELEEDRRCNICIFIIVLCSLYRSTTWFNVFHLICSFHAWSGKCLHLVEMGNQEQP